MPMSYSQPPPFTWQSITPRRPLPVFPPPQPLSAPPLPSAARQPIFSTPYALSSHIFPAAHLRTTDYTPVPPTPPGDAPKAERQALAEKAAQKLKDLRVSLEPHGSKQVLWNCANRYFRRDAQGNGITLFIAHANGFPKEIWEPFLGHLLSSPAASAIDEVWTWESVQHGDACLINGDKIGAVFDWTDNARDILNFLIYFLPNEASSASLPTHLVRIPSDESEYRKSNPFRQRTLVAVGHSYGGCTSALAALTQPKLFSSIILIDPVIVKPTGHLIHKSEHTDRLVVGAILRRETWPSREEAFDILKKSPFFGAWDPAVLKIYIECGTYDTIDPATGKSVIRLKMPGIQEGIVFSETHTEFEVFERLPTLNERIELRWVMPGKPGAGEYVQICPRAGTRD
ncbi:hypothetical protein DXG03_007969 [Asterophora parasitica]|uniref:AB hydrolase-1 domain-containing protein n=1 Tax=Asterophora parasitica TaxID=117018 RepID=A0A9P7KD99_9AGAR|nr:hypothetical protein DXG03_007969 [Asterophora parasitica]